MVSVVSGLVVILFSVQDVINVFGSLPLSSCF